jgi:2-methylcitrate dehydratase PrpD
MKTSSTTQLAQFAASTKSLPSDVADRAKLHIADTVACIYAGTASQPVQVLTESQFPIERSGGRVPVPGWGRVDNSYLAALLIGTCAHADDLDDTSQRSMRGHPSAPVISALLPTAQEVAASGSDFVRAYAIGIEVACKLGAALGPAHRKQGWHTMGTFGALGAAAAAANLRGLDPIRTERALAIACSFAGSLLGNTGTMTKSLHCGRAAHDGYLASALAEKNFTAGNDIFEVKSGFLDAFTDGSIKSFTLPPLGNEWELITPGLAVKLYPSCAGTHLAIDGARRVRNHPDFDVNSITKINCFVSEEFTNYLRFPVPRSAIEGKFSLNYTVAVALLDGDVGFEHFEPGSLNRSDVAALLPKIEMIARSPNVDGPDIEVNLANGKQLTERRDVQRGAPDDPVDWSDVERKLLAAIDRARLRPVNPEALITSLRSLDAAPRVIDIFSL